MNVRKINTYVDEVLTEESAAGEGFLTEVVRAWEAAADPARNRMPFEKTSRSFAGLRGFS